MALIGVGAVSAAACVTLAIVSKNSHLLVALPGPILALSGGGSVYAKRVREQPAQKK